MNRKIKKLLISEDETDNELLLSYLESDYERVIKIIYNVLFSLTKEVKKNEEKINIIYDHIKKLSNELTDVNKLTLMQKESHQFVKRIDQCIPKKRKRDSVVNSLRINCLEHNDDLTEKIKLYNTDNKYKILTNLLFKEKNLLKTEKIINNNIDIILKKYNKGIDIVYEILKRYISLDSDSNDINYYNDILTIILNCEELEFIKNNIDNYRELLKQQEPKEHIEKLINKLDENIVLLEDLEEENNIKFEMPNIVEKESLLFMPKELEYEDFTKQLVITIDGPKTLCIDDAISLEKTGNGYKLYIHITDIPSIVPWNSLTNKEAFKRGETLYLNDRLVNMYPSHLSEDICSLNNNCKRHTISYVYDIDNELNVDLESLKIKRGIINSSFRLTYNEVDYLLQNGSNNKLDKMLYNLAEISFKLKRENKHKEQYRRIENIVLSQFDHESIFTDYLISANIIQELMILVNHTLPKYYDSLGYPFLYRIHELSDKKIIEDDINKLLDLEKIRCIDKNYKVIVDTVKSDYLTAKYSSVNKGHVGLNLDTYSHSTSPARRYADAFGQYETEDLIFNKNISNENIYQWEEKVKQTAAYLNDRHYDNEALERKYNYLSTKKLIRKKEEL